MAGLIDDVVLLDNYTEVDELFADGSVQPSDPSPGADAAAASPVPVQMWPAVNSVPAQMWQRRAQSRCRCGQW